MATVTNEDKKLITLKTLGTAMGELNKYFATKKDIEGLDSLAGFELATDSEVRTALKEAINGVDIDADRQPDMEI